MQELTTKLSEILMAAMFLEAIITYFNQFFINGIFQWQMAVSVVLGIAVSFAYKLDLPNCFSLSSKVTFLGEVITGILISRGSNFIHDFISKIG